MKCQFYFHKSRFIFPQSYEIITKYKKIKLDLTSNSLRRISYRLGNAQTSLAFRSQFLNIGHFMD